MNLASIYFDERQTDKAIDIYKKLIIGHSTNAWSARVSYATLLSKQTEDDVAAIALLNEVIDGCKLPATEQPTKVNVVHAYNSLIICHLNLGHRQKAKEYLVKGMQIMPDYVPFLSLQAKLNPEFKKQRSLFETARQADASRWNRNHGSASATIDSLIKMGEYKTDSNRYLAIKSLPDFNDLQAFPDIHSQVPAARRLKLKITKTKISPSSALQTRNQAQKSKLDMATKAENKRWYSQPIQTTQTSLAAIQAAQAESTVEDYPSLTTEIIAQKAFRPITAKSKEKISLTAFINQISKTEASPIAVTEPSIVQSPTEQTHQPLKLAESVEEKPVLAIEPISMPQTGPKKQTMSKTSFTVKTAETRRREKYLQHKEKKSIKKEIISESWDFTKYLKNACHYLGSFAPCRRNKVMLQDSGLDTTYLAASASMEFT
jgi:tetratricopeptide (TPR) repeat protein